VQYEDFTDFSGDARTGSLAGDRWQQPGFHDDMQFHARTNRPLRWILLISKGRF
jgi:hypothetical protein